ncbi:MAG: hypothetical protein LBO03_02860 [Acidaminococcales bacterium]|jgi:hypothetical protein|nr:hypothetical protein [Acidaminococcales bacterium]
MGGNLSEKELDELAGLEERPKIKPTGRPKRRGETSRLVMDIDKDARQSLKMIAGLLRTSETAALAKVINYYCAANKELIDEYRRTEERLKELKKALGCQGDEK